MIRPWSMLTAALFVLGAGAMAQAPIESAIPSASDAQVLSFAPSEVTFVESWEPARPLFWLRGEYVAWAIGTSKLTELAKESYNSEQFNALLAAGGKDYRDFVETLLGDDRRGMRISAGVWLDQTKQIGFEAGFLYLDRGPLKLNLLRRDLAPLETLLANQSAPELQRPDHPLLVLLLLRRFGVPALDGLGRLILVPYAARNFVDANISLEIAEKSFWMAEAIGKKKLYQSECVAVDGLLGYRRIFYQDNLLVQSNVTTLSPPLIPGLRLDSVDQVVAESTYDGALLGLDLTADFGCLSFSVRPTATIACLRADVTRTGSTTVTFPDQSRLNLPEGTYLRSSEQGTYSTSEWVVIPELAFRATWNICPNIGITVGSSLLYVPRAGRAAENLDIGLDPQRALPGALGTLQNRTVDPPELRAIFMATGSIGLEMRF